MPREQDQLWGLCRLLSRHCRFGRNNKHWGKLGVWGCAPSGVRAPGQEVWGAMPYRSWKLSVA